MNLCEKMMELLIQNQELLAYYILPTVFVMGSILFKVAIVPQQQQWVIERMGKFSRIIGPGLNFLIPFFESIREKHDLREEVIDIDPQTAITKDNVSLHIDGVIYLKVVDARLATYGTNNYYSSVVQLAKTSMRSAIGKMSLDNTFEARETLNQIIVESVDEAARPWGIKCMRYEIKDISVPANVKKSMEMQVAAERQKRADILASEGKKESAINIAEGKRKEVELNSEAKLVEKVNAAKGEAESILMIAEATSQGITKVSKAMGQTNGIEAVSVQIAEKYIEAFDKIAQSANTVIVPANASDPSAMIAQSLSIFKSVLGVKASPTKRTTKKSSTEN